MRRQSQRRSASSETRRSSIPMAQRPTRAPETPLFAVSPCVPRYTAARSASCVSLPLRSAKRPLHAYIHKSTDSLRLPRFRTASHIHARAADFPDRATKSSRFSCRARFPAPATQNDARRLSRSRHSPRLPHETHAACTNPHACHTKPRARRLRWPPFPTPAMRNARSATSN